MHKILSICLCFQGVWLPFEAPCGNCFTMKTGNNLFYQKVRLDRWVYYSERMQVYKLNITVLNMRPSFCMFQNEHLSVIMPKNCLMNPLLDLCTVKQALSLLAHLCLILMTMPPCRKNEVIQTAVDLYKKNIHLIFVFTDVSFCY